MITMTVTLETLRKFPDQITKEVCFVWLSEEFLCLSEMYTSFCSLYKENDA